MGMLGNLFGRKRRPADAADELKALADAEPRQFSWSEVAAWAVKLLLWLLARYPSLMTTVVLQQQRKVAESLPTSDRELALQAVSALGRVFDHSPQLVAKALETR